MDFASYSLAALMSLFLLYLRSVVTTRDVARELELFFSGSRAPTGLVLVANAQRDRARTAASSRRKRGPGGGSSTDCHGCGEGAITSGCNSQRCVLCCNCKSCRVLAMACVVYGFERARDASADDIVGNFRRWVRDRPSADGGGEGEGAGVGGAGGEDGAGAAADDTFGERAARVGSKRPIFTDAYEKEDVYAMLQRHAFFVAAGLDGCFVCIVPRLYAVPNVLVDKSLELNKNRTRDQTRIRRVIVEHAVRRGSAVLTHDHVEQFAANHLFVMSPREREHVCVAEDVLEPPVADAAARLLRTYLCSCNEPLAWQAEAYLAAFRSDKIDGGGPRLLELLRSLGLVVASRDGCICAATQCVHARAASNALRPVVLVDLAAARRARDRAVAIQLATATVEAGAQVERARAAAAAAAGRAELVRLRDRSRATELQRVKQLAALVYNRTPYAERPSGGTFDAWLAASDEWRPKMESVLEAVDARWVADDAQAVAAAAAAAAAADAATTAAVAAAAAAAAAAFDVKAAACSRVIVATEPPVAGKPRGIFAVITGRTGGTLHISDVSIVTNNPKKGTRCSRFGHHNVSKCPCREHIQHAIGDDVGAQHKMVHEPVVAKVQAYLPRMFGKCARPPDVTRVDDGSARLGSVVPDVLSPVVPACSCAGGTHVASGACFSTCPLGHAWGESVACPSAKSTVLFSSGGIVVRPQHIRHCSAAACEHSLKFDGSEHDYLVVNSAYGVSHELLCTYENVMYLTGMTLAAYADSLMLKFERMYGEAHFREQKAHVLSRGRLAAAVSAFRSLVDYSTRDKVCPTCGDHPAEIVMDGIMQGVLSERLSQLAPDPREPVPGVVAAGLSYKGTFFIDPSAMSKDAYKTVLAFVRTPPQQACPIDDASSVPPIVTKADPAIMPDVAEKMLDDVKASSSSAMRALHPLLAEAVRRAVKVGDDGAIVCPPAFAHVLFPLVTHSAFFAAHEPASVERVLKDLLVATTLQDGDLGARLGKTVPWFSFFLRDVGAVALPLYARSTVEAIVEDAAQRKSWEQTYLLDGAAVAKTLEQLLAGSDAEKAAAAAVVNALLFTPTTAEQDLREGGYYAPSLRQRRNGFVKYAVRHDDKDDPTVVRSRACPKDSPTTASHSPGIFSCLCSHGYVYALILLRNGESPEHAFRLIYDRFPPDKLPRVVVYDNACNAMRYALRREPGLFASVRFLVDRLHWPNHARCSTHFRMFEHSAYDVVIRTLDSQRAEQWNKMLARLTTHIHYSNPYHAMMTLRSFAGEAAAVRERKAASERFARDAHFHVHVEADDEFVPSLGAGGAADDDDAE